MGLINLDIISTVVQRSFTGRPVPTGNTIIMQGGADIDNIIDRITADLRDKYLSKTTDDEALGLINFKQGLKIGGVELKYDQDNNAVFIERADGVPVNFYVTGGMAMYGLGNTKVTSILDAIEENLDPNTLGIVNGKLTVIGGGSGGEGGITTVTKQMVIDALGFTPYSAENPNGYITAASIPAALKNPYALTFGNKTYDGSAAKSITASDLGAALSSDLANYLPLTATTTPMITNSQSAVFNLKSTAANEVGFRLFFNEVNTGGLWANNSLIYLYNAVASSGLRLGNDKTLTYRYDGTTYNVYHSGNLTKLSQLTDDVVSGKYLPLSGGTIQVDNVGKFNVYNTAQDGSYVHFFATINSAKTDLGYIGINKDKVPTFMTSGGVANKLWHEGNDGSGSGLDADLLDGKQPSELNVGSATKLQTARTLWGQSFDGTEDITGSLKIPNDYTLRWFNNAGADINCIYLSNENKFFIGNGVAEKGYDTYFSGKNLIFRYGTSRTEGVRIDSSGNVGIGTTGPSSKLDVRGQIMAYTSLTDGFVVKRNNTAAGAYIKYLSNNQNEIGWRVGVNSEHKFLFAYSKDSFSNSSTRVTFSHNGNVGIGITAPAYLLDVNGTALVTELRIRRGLDNAANMRFYSPSSSKNIAIENGSGDGNIIFNTNVGGAGIKEVGRFRGNDGGFSLENHLIFNNSKGDNRSFKIAWSNYLTRPAIAMWSYSSSLGFSDMCLGTSNDAINGILYFRGDTRNWGISTYAPDPSAKLHVNGNVLVEGGLTFYSQRSLKNVVDERGLSLTELSSIKPIRYKWKDKRDDRIHFGGIADDIEKVLPEVIYKTADGTLTMDYGNAAFAVATSLIKPVVDHDIEIRMLKIRVKELEEEIKRYSA